MHLWRRGFSVRPPPIEPSDPRHPRFDCRYRHLPVEWLPATESLADTMDRVLALWREEILPHLCAAERILIAAHGNSLRALVKHLDNIPDDDITELNIPSGVPLVYEFDDRLNVVTHYYLADEACVQSVARAVAHQATPPPH